MDRDKCSDLVRVDFLENALGDALLDARSQDLRFNPVEFLRQPLD